MRFLWILLLVLTLLLALAFQNVNGDANRKKTAGNQAVTGHESRGSNAGRNHPHAQDDRRSSSHKHKKKPSHHDRKHKGKKHPTHKQASHHGSKTHRRSFD